ncbi:thiamine phosphate synthase [Alteromonas ponticola]|uniref:Thiamine-phosphate synthase n=1 Tax=Alteromonas ponticola TaxID=2720613 RepID=A0ABX1R2J5_9ALTE|nr:thiamine phosphate synthase [Alteromonas ponticola]NMH59851.1 thiamine phosphate synthase [Alteromonas ponticola]
MGKPVTMWSIGGLDPSGAAGITRDCVTAERLGVHVCPIATMLTAQPLSSTSGGAKMSVSAVSLEMFKQQINSQQTEPPNVIKIGALANDAQIDTLINTLIKLRSHNDACKVVMDPVLSTTTGLQLSSCTPAAILSLLPYIDVITPNIEELSWLTQLEIHGTDEAKHAATHLLAAGVNAVLIKGGHANWDNQATDWLITSTGEHSFASLRYEKVALRGTGCRLASALAAALIKGHTLDDAVCFAKSTMMRKLNKLQPSQCLLTSNSTFTHLLPYVGPAQISTSAMFPPLIDNNIGIYPVVDSVEWIKRLLHTGIKVIQLRIKAPVKNLMSQIREAVAVTECTGCQLFINDYWQEAIAAGAYGVHLGQEDLIDADLSTIARAGLRLGVSTHGYVELARVLPVKPSYIALGHIFATTTKVMPSAPQGIARLVEYKKYCGNIPTVAIGGINSTNFSSVVNTGVNGVAVVSAILKAGDPIQASHTLQRRFMSEQNNAD